MYTIIYEYAYRIFCEYFDYLLILIYSFCGINFIWSMYKEHILIVFETNCVIR